MALLYKARLTPSKLDALAAWLPGQPWAAGLDVTVLAQAGSFRFDDPAGAVGIETLLVHTADGVLLQVPLTYRSAPLDGAEGALVATMEHSVLGPRWAYDGCADPVAVRALVTTVLTGGHEAELEIDSGDGVPVRREPTARVTGGGAPGTAVPAADAVTATSGASATVIAAGAVTVTVRRRLAGVSRLDGTVLLGTWAGTDAPVVLATVR